MTNGSGGKEDIPAIAMAGHPVVLAVEDVITNTAGIETLHDLRPGKILLNDRSDGAVPR